MRVDLFDFDLPDELIAQRPVQPRDAARLLDVAPDGLHDRTVRDLPSLLRRGDRVRLQVEVTAFPVIDQDERLLGAVVMFWERQGP